MKNLFKSICFLIVFMLGTSIESNATENIVLNRNFTNGDSVEVSVDNVNSIVTSFQLSLKLQGDVKLNTIVWDDQIKNEAKANYKYNTTENVVDIYVTSKLNLVNEKGSLVIGTLKVEGPKKGSFNVLPNTDKVNGAMKLVSNTHKETVVSKITVIEKPEDGSGSGNGSDNNENNGPNTGNNGVENNVGATTGGSSTNTTSKPDSSNTTNSEEKESEDTSNTNENGDVENEILSGEKDEHENQTNENDELGKEESYSKSMFIYVFLAITITVVVGSGIYLKTKK
ncbi:MAG: hypothetical protein RR620_00970 [Clostridium sp.]